MESSQEPAASANPNSGEPTAALVEADVRAIARARSAVTVFRGFLIVIGLISAFGVPNVLRGILIAETDRRPFREALPMAIVFVGVAATWFTLRRWPRAALASCVAVILGSLGALLVTTPFSDWFARERDIGDWAILTVAAIFFVPLIGFGLRRNSPWLTGIGGYFTLHAVIWSYYCSAPATALVVGTALALGAIVAGSRVHRAWPAIRRHPGWFFESRRRRRRWIDAVLSPHPTDPGLRASSGVARSYLRWKRLSRPSIRSGGVGGLGIH